MGGGWTQGSGSRSVLPEPCLWLTGVQASGLCTCASATGDGGICIPIPSRSGMPMWRGGDYCSGAEMRSMRKEHAQQSRWCRQNCENGAISRVLVDCSTELLVLLM